MTAATSHPLDYATARPDPIAHAMEAERVRWLRKRFLWFCVASIVLTCLVELGTSDHVRSPDAGRRAAAWASIAGSAAAVAMYAAAGWYAWRTPPRKRPILALAFWLTVLSWLVSLAAVRVSMELSVEIWTDDPNAATPAQAWAVVATLSLLMGHLMTCLFIPWTVRESVRPAAVIISVIGVVVILDVALRHLSPWWLVTLAFLASAAVPGALVCWWRYSRFRGRFRLVFESAAYRKLQHELAGARQVHESCLPPPCDDGPVRLSYVYEPTREIGGDLIFVHRPGTNGAADKPGHAAADARAMTVVVLDVTGHGIAAALSVNRLVGELERLFAERTDASPGDVLCALNRYVCLTMARYNLYVSALCLRADPGRDVVEWASGGHPTAFLRRADGSIAALESTAFLLGVCDAGEYCADPGSLPFHSGDAVVAYTDGAAEAADPGARQLGTRGVLTLVEEASANCKSPREWPSTMLYRVAAHREGPPEDDTLLVTLFRPV